MTSEAPPRAQVDVEIERAEEPISPPTAEPSVAPETLVIEKDERLSRSLLWKLQRRYFGQQGIDAWRQGTVPHYITSNPYIAQAYARVVFGFLRDCRGVAADDGHFASVDPTQPVYIVELGAGSGRFAYHFLRKLLEMLQRSILRDAPVKYVMTDFNEGMIEYWRAHPSLQPLVESGHLDFARFDAENDEEIALSLSGVVLSADTVRNPLIVIANYFFDSVAQDAFSVREGHLHESLVTLTSTQLEPDPTDPDLLGRITLSFQHRPVSADYYDDPALDRILQTYEQELPEATLLFPCSALRCLRALGRLSSGRLLLLSGDKGYSRQEDLLANQEPAIAVHGSFSLMVNYHALGQYVRNQGGLFLHTSHRHSSLEVCAFLLGEHPNGYPDTCLAYWDAVEKGGPDDFFTLRTAFGQGDEALTLDQVLSYLRWSGWDADSFAACLPTIAKHLDGASEYQKQELQLAIRHVWDTYYPIGERYDLAFQIGLVLHSMGCYPEALEYFRRSTQLYGPDSGALYNMALCHYSLRQFADALRCVNDALVLNPELEPARALRIVIPPQIRGSATASAAPSGDN